MGLVFFALALPGQGPALGSAGFLVLALLIKSPLLAMIGTEGLKRRWLILFAFFALAGCLPFSSFSAYFQTFIPLMSESASVDSMSQKLFSGAGLWAAIVLLSVVYQSCALGYFYWSRLLQSGQEPVGEPWNAKPWLLAFGLAASLSLGIFRQGYGTLLRSGLSAMGVVIQ